MIDIPNYEIGKLAGRGGVAEVYLARHKLLDRTVAIKIISPSQADDLADKRFLKEARVVAGLRHPNIVSIYDVGVYENKYYIIMEYLEGGDLKQNVQRTLSIPQTLKIIRQITSALAHAHDKGFVHRDIKSQNIMFRSDGTAVLTDFGIVKDLTADTGYTLDGTSIGTPHYMSPEQAQGTGEVDWRTDLYSLGVTFYEMLTGSVPYNADSAIAVALKHIKDPVPQLPEQFTSFQPIIDKLMAKNPDDRFQSAHDLLRAIGELDGEGSPIETVVLKHKSVRKVKPANIFLGVAIVFIISGLMYLSQPYLARFMDRQKIPDDKPQPAKIRQVNPPAQTPKKPFLDVIKKKWTPSVDPEHLPEQLTELIVKKDYSEALNYISQIRKEMPETGNEMMQKADQFLESKQYMNAGDIFNTVLSVDPQNTSALLGLLYVAIEKQQTMATNQNPSIAEYDALLALLNKAINNTDSQYFKQLKIESVESVYESASHQLEQQRFKQAGIWAKTGLKNAPDHLRLKKLGYLIQAQISFNENRLTLPDQDNALAYYRQVLQLDPDDQAARQGITRIIDKYKTMALAAQKEHNYNEAVELIGKARLVAPNNPELQTTEWLILGDMYASKGQFNTPENENARHFYQKILAQSPQNKQAVVRIAKIEVLIPLHQVRQTGPLSKKIPAYKTLFSELDSAITEHGQENMADLKHRVIELIKEDMQAQKKQKQPIPAEFMTLVSGHFPDENEIFNTHYDILIAKGDEATSKQEKADYYLKALKLNPAHPRARVKIEHIVKDLDNHGKANEAKAVLKEAMDIAPDHTAFNDMFQTIKKIQDTKAEIFTLLLKIKRIQTLPEKVELYKALFSKLDSAIDRFGLKTMKDLKNDVTVQVKTDIKARKNSRQTIPAELMTLVENDFPEMNEYVVNAQYDILIANGDKSTSKQKKADYYLNALKLDKHRSEAKNGIELLAKNLDKNGNNKEAVAVLQKAMDIAPKDLIFSELFGKIRRILEVFATNSGCGKENIISQAPVSIENLSLCIQYRNLDPNSVVNVVLNQKNGQTMEIPVVLDDRSGSKPIDVVTPIEGFALGDYSITVRQNGKILSETLIKFIPKRR
ncbi:MAG: protein kinase [Desulfobacteraceae bacterium]|nr:protein kinase [Desulfobacteraceae bacterium]MBC2756561.1 protein kinase [Desulfobacteraceae bacterium]